MLIEDLRDSVARDELPLDRMLSLVPVIAADPDDKVARMSLTASTMPLRGVDDALWTASRRWYVQTFGPRARQLGWHRGPHDTEERHQLRQDLIDAVDTDDPVVMAEAAKLADRWLADRSGIEDDMAGNALWAAAHHGDAARFDRYLAAAKAARDRTEQQRILGALGAFTNPEIARRALALVLGHDLDLRDTRNIVFGALSHRETRDLALAFVTDHLDELLARMRSDEAAGFLGGLSGSSCDPERRARIAALALPRAAKIEGAEGQVKRGLELTDQCIALTARELPAMRRVLGVN
jgi:hypothetical protein